jgi:hypothetical protein
MIENLASLRAQFAAQPPKLSSHFDEGDPRRLEHLSLEQQKKRARDLLRTWRANPPQPGGTPKLSEAQHAIARGYGFSNWAGLKAHIEQARVAREALKGGAPSALDGRRRTLHIRCGNDIQRTLAVAGFSGDFMMFPDPYVHGPVPHTATLEEFIHIRATYISSDNNPPYEVVLKDLTRNYADLEKARDYDAVYLWFEHDSYDQLTLAKLLDFFSDPGKRPPVLKMITVTHFPGVKIFNGIGQLPPEALRILWQEFSDVTAAQLAIGRQAWAALRSPTPRALQDLVATGTPELPTMARALDRHLRQLPSMRNGLNLTENLTLKILDDKGAMNAARLFGWYTNHYEPLTFMGDSGYWHVLEDLAAPRHPAIVLDKQGGRPNEWQVALTPTGRELLANRADWLELNPVDRWVGGIHIDSRAGRIFRVDDTFS